MALTRARKRAVLIGVAIVSALILLVAGVGKWTDIFGNHSSRHTSGAPSGVTRTKDTAPVSPAKSTTLKVTGATLTVPAGAVHTATTAHLSLGGYNPITGLTKQGQAAIHGVTKPIQVDLSGQQPSTPLTLTLDVPPDTKPSQLVMVSKHAGHIRSFTGTYNAANHTYVVKLTKLSPHILGSIDLGAVYKTVEGFMDTILKIVGITSSRPSCAKASTTSGGYTVKITGLHDADRIWPCASVDANGLVHIDVHSGSGIPWRVQPSIGAYNGAAETELNNAMLQALYKSLDAQHSDAEGLVVPQGEGHWTANAEGDWQTLPVDVTAKAAPGYWFAEVAIYGALSGIDILSGGQSDTALKADKLAKALELPKNIECLGGAAKAMPDGAKLTLDNIIAVSQAALKCLDPIREAIGIKPLTGIAGAVFGFVLSGIPLIWGALETSIRSALSLKHDELNYTWHVTASNTSQAAFQPFVGTWQMHTDSVVINANHTGVMGWNAGMCYKPSSPKYMTTGVCSGEAAIKLSPEPGGLQATLGQIKYVSGSTGATIPHSAESGADTTGNYAGRVLHFKLTGNGKLASKPDGSVYCGEALVAAKAPGCYF